MLNSCFKILGSFIKYNFSIIKTLAHAYIWFYSMRKKPYRRITGKWHASQESPEDSNKITAFCKIKHDERNKQRRVCYPKKIEKGMNLHLLYRISIFIHIFSFIFKINHLWLKFKYSSTIPIYNFLITTRALHFAKCTINNHIQAASSPVHYYGLLHPSHYWKIIFLASGTLNPF